MLDYFPHSFENPSTLAILATFYLIPNSILNLLDHSLTKLIQFYYEHRFTIPPLHFLAQFISPICRRNTSWQRTSTGSSISFKLVYAAATFLNINLPLNLCLLIGPTGFHYSFFMFHHQTWKKVLPWKKLHNIFHAREVAIFNLLMYNPKLATNMKRCHKNNMLRF